MRGNTTVFLLAAFSAAGCGDEQGAPEAIQQALLACDASGNCTSGPNALIDLISLNTCTRGPARLTSCNIPSLAIKPPLTDTAVPLRTVALIKKTGTCTTNFPLAVSVQADTAEARIIRFSDTAPERLRLSGGSALGVLHLADATTWTKHAAFDPSCQIQLDVSFNEPDVDTKEQAAGVIALLDGEVLKARDELERYRQLLLLYSGYSFIHEVAESFHQELTNELMQRLRVSAAQGKDAIKQMLRSRTCTDVVTDDEALDHVAEVVVGLAAVGDAASWTRPDGTTKTLADFFGPGATQIEQSIKQLETRANFALEQQYKDKYDAAAKKVVAAEARLAEARLTLASWL